MDPRLLPDLIVYLEVVRSGSITAAAARLHTVQSNVTARIRKLEGVIGVPLLKRHARGVKPTHAGEAALVFALRMNSVLQDIRFAFGRGGERVARFRIGAIETVLAVHLPGVASRFLQQFPNVDLSIHAASTATITQQIVAGELDVGFVSQAPKVPGLRTQLAFRDELVIVAPGGILTLRDLVSVRNARLKVLVQRLGCSYTEKMIKALETKSSRAFRLLELGTLEGVLGFVEAGFGIAAMPRSFVDSLSAKRRVSLIDLPPGVRKLETYLIAPAAGDSRAVVNEFLSLCQLEPLRRCSNDDGRIRSSKGHVVRG